MRQDNLRTLKASSPPLGRPKDLIKRSAILDAARDLFFAHGVVPVTIDAIAKKAKVSRMTVYAHFGNKQTLFREVIKRQATTLADAVAFAPEAPSRHGAGGVDELKQELTIFGSTFVHFLSRPDIKAWNRLRQEEAKNYPDLAKTFTQGASVVISTLATRLESAHNRHQLTVPDPVSAARQLIGMLASSDVCSAMGFHEKQTATAIKKHVEDCVSAFLRAYVKSAAKYLP